MVFKAKFLIQIIIFNPIVEWVKKPSADAEGFFKVCYVYELGHIFLYGLALSNETKQVFWIVEFWNQIDGAANAILC
ncbi:hypothetical protein DTO96_101631 [Ephemeroptericola cinctiostellae]|uniref:Uncharacterized protein n=1 Tax=Ephemeroptericola cinctiostellae TaxID=2268024 RepID=A0A345DC03_9BURK|nr:hypothetical protein DTO96_101631 [Ephemeroptericola cinctiostellae]